MDALTILREAIDFHCANTVHDNVPLISWKVLVCETLRQSGINTSLWTSEKDIVARSAAQEVVLGAGSVALELAMEEGVVMIATADTFDDQPATLLVLDPVSRHEDWEPVGDFTHRLCLGAFPNAQQRVDAFLAHRAARDLAVQTLPSPTRSRSRL